METVMLKKTFIGVLFVALVYTFLIAGINLNGIKAANYSGSDTTVGGIIWENTTWTLENSPYIITETVQIPGGVTLTIEPGVYVTKPTAGDMFLLKGTICAHGSIDKKITFDGGGNSNFFNMDACDSLSVLDLDYCIFKNGNSFWYSTKSEQWASLSLKHSELYELSSGSNMYYFRSTGHKIYIEYNKFINSAGFLIGRDSDVYTSIKYNLFKGNRGPVLRLKPVSSGSMNIKYNSFIDMQGIAVELCISIDQDVSENYWGTTNTEIIDTMIYDGNDDIRINGFINYVPILPEPHQETPIMLEDVNVGINGIFREDSDDKWRCYTNVTIRNNSYRNVTIPWFYVNAINITYIDETFEALGISGNETLNFVLQPQQEFSLTWTITEFGFTKEPRILWILFKTPIIEAYGTITLIEPIPEFPSTMILPLLTLTTLIATGLLRKKRKTKLP
jgi:hypothetical protein